MNTVAAILIIISGNTYGDTVQVTRFESMTECQAAKTITQSIIETEGSWRTKPHKIDCKSLAN